MSPKPRYGPVASDHSEPSRQRAASRIKLRGVSPKQKKNILQNLFGRLRIAENAVQK